MHPSCVRRVEKSEDVGVSATHFHSLFYSVDSQKSIYKLIVKR